MQAFDGSENESMGFMNGPMAMVAMFGAGLLSSKLAGRGTFNSGFSRMLGGGASRGYTRMAGRVGMPTATDLIAGKMPVAGLGSAFHGFARGRSTVSRLRTTYLKKFHGDPTSFLTRMRLEDVNPRLAKAIDRKVGLFNRGVRKEMQLYKMMRRVDPRMANRMIGVRALKSFSGFANWMFAIDLAGAGVSMLSNAASAWRPSTKINSRRTLETGSNYVDTQEAYTQRQAALQAIHNSQLTTRAVIGNEAAMMHG